MTEKINIIESDLPDIVVKPEDLPPANTPQWDSALGFFKGEPWVRNPDGSSSFSVPDVPYVFQGIIRQTGETGFANQQNANILVSHGLRDRNGNWVFKDGRQVKDFIGTYDANNPSTPITAVAVCNPTHETGDSVIQAVDADMQVSAYLDPIETKTIVHLRSENSDQNLIIVPGQTNQ